jgi:protein gp37
MGRNSSISWTDVTWNIAVGCSKVDKDCLYCYMYRDGKRYGYDPREIRRTKTVFNLPLKIKEPSRIFTSSLTDVFHPAIDSFRDEMWEIIRQCPHHTFQVLTKRPERIVECLPDDWGDGWNNVWMGTSIGHQEAIGRIHQLLEVPASKRFVSFEPLWSKVDMNLDLSDLCSIDWAIIGGESGNETGMYRYRPCTIEWIESLISDLTPTTSIFVKQLGTHLAKEMGLKDRNGGDIDEWPEHLRIREFPK